MGGCLLQVRIRADKLRRCAVAEAQQVVQHQNLSVAVGPGADADGRNAEPLRHPRGQLARNSFQHQGKRTGIFESLGILDDTVRIFQVLPLDVIAALGVKRLRRQAQVAHDGNLRFHQMTYDARPPLAAFDLDGFRAAFLDEAKRRRQRPVGTPMKSAVGHVGHQQTPPQTAPHGSNVVKDLLDRNRQGGVVTQNNLCQRVADQDEVDRIGAVGELSFIHPAGGGIVVGGQAGNLFAVEFLLQQRTDGHFAHGLIARVHGVTSINNLLQAEEVSLRRPQSKNPHGENREGKRTPVQAGSRRPSVSVCRGRSKR